MAYRGRRHGALLGALILVLAVVAGVVVLRGRATEQAAAPRVDRPCLAVQEDVAPSLVGYVPKSSRGEPREDEASGAPRAEQAGASPAGVAYPAENVTLDVRVVDELHRPVPGAHVFPRWCDVAASGGWTDEEGACAIEAPIHSRSLEVDEVRIAEGDERRFALVTYWPLEPGVRDVRIMMRTYVPIDGRIMDENGAPLAHVEIAAYSDRSREGLGYARVGSGMSDASGAFRFTVASAQRVDLCVHASPASGGRCAWLRDARPGAWPVELRAALPDFSRRLEVFVRDERGSLEGANLYVEQCGRSIGRARTRAPGRILIEGLLPLPCRIAVDAPDHAGVTRTVDADARDVEVSLRAVDPERPARSHLEGRVVRPDGRPAVAAAVTAYDGNAAAAHFETDANGNFYGLIDVKPGTSLQVSARWGPNDATLRGHVSSVEAAEPASEFETLVF